jgi:predicted ester cyclase
MDHAVTMRRMYSLLSGRDIEGFGALLADDFVDHEDLPGLSPTKEGAVAFFRMYVAAFSRPAHDAGRVIASGDNAVARARATGSHRGTFMGLSPTGRRVDVQLIEIIRFGADGRAREHWGVFDQLAMMQQLGAMPAGPPT